MNNKSEIPMGDKTKKGLSVAARVLRFLALILGALAGNKKSKSTPTPGDFD